jgi:hypothetical protein
MIAASRSVAVNGPRLSFPLGFFFLIGDRTVPERLVLSFRPGALKASRCPIASAS